MKIDLAEKIKSLPDINFPDNLHGKIMRKILFLRVKNQFLLVALFLVGNIILSGWHAWVNMVRLETIPVLSALLEGFEFSFEFIRQLYNTITTSVPVTTLSVFIVNVVVASYLFYLYFNLKNIRIVQAQGRTN